MARRFFPGEDPIGKHIFILDPLQADIDAVSQGPREIIGLVEDVRESGPDKEFWPEAYFSYEQFPVRAMAVMLRIKGSSAIVPDIQRQAMQVDPDQPIYNVRPMEQQLDTIMNTRRFQVSSIVVFAAIALILAVSGLYSVISYSVVQRKQEIGIRMALGAEPSKVVRMILSDGIKLGGIGIVLGVFGGLLLTRFIYTMLYAISPKDPSTFSIVTIVLSAVIVVASYLPAQRAAKVEPSRVLRSE